MSQDKLPRDAEAEKRVIGSLLLVPERYEEVTTVIPKSAFRDPAYRALFVACGECMRVHGSIDTKLLASYLRDREAFGNIQPAQVALDACKDVSTAAHLDHFVQRLSDVHCKTRLYDVCSSTLESISSEKHSSEILVDMGADLEGISRAQCDEGLRPISGVQPEEVQWIWPGWLAAGSFHMFDGDPEVGKSQVTCDVAARITTGREFPFQDRSSCPPGNVLLIAGEDSVSHTIRPRLDAAGADTDRVFYWSEDGELPTLPSKVGKLRHCVERYDIKLIVMDPVTAYLDGDINAHKDADVRRALLPLTAMARDHGVAVVGIRHLNKDEGKSALYRGGGSIGFVAVARVAWVIAYEDASQDRRVLAVNKCNIAPKPKACVLSIVKRQQDLVSHVEWDEQSDRMANDLLTKDSPSVSQIGSCKEMLEAMLFAGPKPESEVRSAVLQAGISERTYKRARGQLNIKACKQGYQGQFFLQLPAADQDKACQLF